MGIISAVNSKPPHIVFIVADDLGWNDVGFNNPHMITPHIDKLAGEGVILNQSYVQPLCSPSRHSFMTGYYPFHAGLQHRVIMPGQAVCSPLNMQFLPKYLKELGYATHMVGKWHLGFCKWECTPTHRGFDSFFGYYNAQEDYYTHDWEGGYDLRQNERLATEFNGTYSLYSYDKAAADIILKHNASQPLFLYMAFQNVHDPIEVPKKFEDMYPDIQNEGRRKFSGMVTALDEAVGNITNKLAQKGMMDDTLFVFTADNGGWPLYYGNNYPLRGAKFTIYEGGTRAAGFVRGPGLNVTGKRFDGLMHAVDWLPTLVSVGGGSSPPAGYKGDGVNMWPALSQLSTSPRTELVYNIDDLFPYEEGHAAIRVGNYKLIDGYPGLYPDWYKPQTEESDYSISEIDAEQFERNLASKYQLYNLKDDPTEHNDLSSKEPDIVSKLAARLKYYHDTMVPANYPLPNPFSSPKLHGGAWSPGWC
ncbi:arylsulfatase B-like [Ylistrum balloti]|uniref:arylsulfatase B-like n=1 Tax=Ylistrum balloti TaxID=509963 RepID=UPI002905940B|nr:arylsulfatase B-like [Ylistrum balloti]